MNELLECIASAGLGAKSIADGTSDRPASEVAGEIVTALTEATIILIQAVLAVTED